MGKAKFGEGTEWKFWKQKGEGAQGPGEFGGFYKTEDSTGNVVKRALIKSEQGNVPANISEFLGSKIFAATAPGYGADVSLMVPSEEAMKKKDKTSLPEDGSEVYVKSEFFKNYADDMYADVDANMPGAVSRLFRKGVGKEDKDKGKLGRPLFMGTRDALQEIFEKQKYTGFEQIAPTSLLIGDFDVHTGNIGVIREEGQAPRLVRIDFGAAFTKLENEVHPNSNRRHLPLPGQGPTNHFREFPQSLKLNDQFVEGLFKTANSDIGKVVDESFAEMQKYYQAAVIAEWAKKAMPEKFKDKDNITIDEVKNEFKEVMKARQASLKEYGIQIKLGLLIEKGPDNKYQFKEGKQEEFLKLVADNQQYFSDVVYNKKEFKFRDHSLRDTIGKSPAEKFINSEMRTALQNVSQTREASSPGVSSRGSGVVTGLGNAELAPDFVLRESAARGVGFAEAGRVSGGGIDPITEAVRREVIERQRQALQDYLNRQYPSEGIDKLSSDGFKGFLGDSKNKDRIVGVINKAEVQQQLQEIEQRGYKAIIENPSNNFQPIVWDSEPQSTKQQGAGEVVAAVGASEQRAAASADGQTIRSQVIKNGDQELCTLRERTSNLTQPVEVPVTTIEGKKSVTIKNYRTVDFATQLSSNSGPMHLSLAVKDEEGRNIAKKDAVYFTAHYDESGKLVEVSAPMPIKFMGEGDNAIGYIERNGHVYTLPVTKGNYINMMQAVGRGQEVENLIQVTASPTVEAPDIVKTGSEKKAGAAREQELPASPTLEVRPPSYNTAINTQSPTQPVNTARATVTTSVGTQTEGMGLSAQADVNVSKQRVTPGGPSLTGSTNKQQASAPVNECLGMEYFADLDTAKIAGGLTGSKVIKGKKDDIEYQLKDSLQDLTVTNRIKGNISSKQMKRGVRAGNLDHENFAEVIASRVSRSLVGGPEVLGAELIPDVYVVYDKNKQRCLVASRYVKDVVGDLDKYAKKTGGVKIDCRIKNDEEVEGHTRVIFAEKSAPLKHDEFSIANDSTLDSTHPKNQRSALLRKDLARAIGVSILSGDHDVNPGNMVVVKDTDGRDRIARIDFGHAANDLTNAFISDRLFGGGVKDKGNRVLDFLNREKIAGFGKEAQLPKLWRDYEGMIPSRELAEAFKELAVAPDLNAGIKSAKESFLDLVKKAKDSPEALAHITESLNKINEHIGGTKITKLDDPNKVIEQVFNNMHKFYEDGQAQMHDAAKVMELQCDIDQFIKESRDKRVSESGVIRDKGLSNLLTKIDIAYKDLEKREKEGIGLGEGKGIKWLKTGKDNAAFKGTLENYIAERSNQLAPELEQLPEVKAVVKLQSDIDAMIRSHPSGGYPDPALLESVQKQYTELEKQNAGEGKGLKWLKPGEYSPNTDSPDNLAAYITKRGKELGRQTEGLDLSNKIVKGDAVSKAKGYQVQTDKVVQLQVSIEQLISNNKAEPKIFNAKLLSHIKTQYEKLGGKEIEWRSIEDKKPAIGKCNLEEYIKARGAEKGVDINTKEVIEKIKIAPTALPQKISTVVDRMREQNSQPHPPPPPLSASVKQHQRPRSATYSK